LKLSSAGSVCKYLCCLDSGTGSSIFGLVLLEDGECVHGTLRRKSGNRPKILLAQLDLSADIGFVIRLVRFHASMISRQSNGCSIVRWFK